MTTKESSSQHKVHLLMEETGCDQGEAELALVSAGYNLEMAIRTIDALLRNIVVVKAKFQLSSGPLYGLLILIADTRRQMIFRLRCVISYNPAIFEKALRKDWYEFEKKLYAYRLWEGTRQKMTQDLERAITEVLEKKGPSFYDFLREEDSDLQDFLYTTVKAFFSTEPAFFEIRREELSLRQFKHLKPEAEELESPVPPAGDLPRPKDSKNLQLEVSLEEDSKGVLTQELRSGDVAFVLLTDDRDIAQYVAKLLGGHNAEGASSLSVPVEEIEWNKNKDKARLQLRLSTGIIGVAHLDRGQRVRLHHRAWSPWWKRWLRS